MAKAAQIEAFHQTARKGQVDVLRKLLAAGVKVDAPLDGGETAIYRAAMYGKVEAFRFLLAEGADPRRLDDSGTNLLAPAAMGGKREIVQALLDLGLDPNHANQFGHTPLMHVRSAPAAKLLIEAGADVNAQTPEYGETPLKAAAELPKVREVLLAAGAVLDPRQDAARGRTSQRVERARGAARKYQFRPAEIESFILAAGQGEVAVVEQLLALGMPVNVERPAGNTALYRAVANGEAAVLRVLLAAGADPRTTPIPDSTWLISAAYGGNAEVIGALLGMGFDVNEADDEGFTPLMAAASLGHADVVRALLAAGADPSVKGRVRHGLRPTVRTALDLARSARHKSVIGLLEQAGGGSDPLAFAFEELKKFKAAAQSKTFQGEVARVAKLCGHAARPWKKRAGVYDYYFKNVAGLAKHFSKADLPAEDCQRRTRLIELLQDEVRAAGFCLTAADLIGDTGTLHLRLFPTREKFAAIAANGTNGDNHGLTSRDVLAWLHALDQQAPFILMECWHDAVGGRFTTPLRDPASWAARMRQFCPDLDGTDQELARDLKESQSFFFWWD